MSLVLFGQNLFISLMLYNTGLKYYDLFCFIKVGFDGVLLLLHEVVCELLELLVFLLLILQEGLGFSLYLCLGGQVQLQR